MKLMDFFKKNSKNVSEQALQKIQLKDFVSINSVISIRYQQNIKPLFSTVQEILENSFVLTTNNDKNFENLKENCVVRCKLSKSDCEYVMDGFTTAHNKNNFVVTPIKITKYPNKRKHNRIPVHYEASVILEEEETKELQGIILNISKTGILLSFSGEVQDLRVGKECKFKLHCPNKFDLEFYGVLSRKQKNQENNAFDFGIQFTNITHQNIQSIDTLIHSLQDKNT